MTIVRSLEPRSAHRPVGRQERLGAQAESLGDVQPALATLSREGGDGVDGADVGFVRLALGEVDLGRHQEQLGVLEVVAGRRGQADGTVDEVLGVVEQVGVGKRRGVVGVQARQVGLGARLAHAVLGRDVRVERFGQVALDGLDVREVRQRERCPGQLVEVEAELDRGEEVLPRGVVLAALGLDRAEVGERLQLGELIATVGGEIAAGEQFGDRQLQPTETVVEDPSLVHERRPVVVVDVGFDLVEEGDRLQDVASVGDLERQADPDPGAHRDVATHRRDAPPGDEGGGAATKSPSSRCASPAIHHSSAASSPSGSPASRSRAASSAACGSLLTSARRAGGENSPADIDVEGRPVPH